MNTYALIHIQLTFVELPKSGRNVIQKFCKPHNYDALNVQKFVNRLSTCCFIILFLAFDFCGFCVVILYFIPATTANDL